MMIDEADEFVAGPQNKHKRPGEPNMQGIPKRRRCMSPLLRGRQQNPVVNNHIGGKGPPIPMIQAQPDLIKPLPLHKSKSLKQHQQQKHYLLLFGSSKKRFLNR